MTRILLVILMLSVTNKRIMLSVVMLSVAIKSIMLRVTLLTVVKAMPIRTTIVFILNITKRILITF
jgi:hypothetical protein